MGILAMMFLPIGLWRIDKANLFIRTFLFLINKRHCTIFNYHKGKRRTSPYSRQKFSIKFLPIGLWRIDEADLFIRMILSVINKRCWTIYNYHKGKRRTLPYSSFLYDFGFSNKIGSSELLKDVPSYNTLETSWKKDNSRSDHSDQV